LGALKWEPLTTRQQTPTTRRVFISVWQPRSWIGKIHVHIYIHVALPTASEFLSGNALCSCYKLIMLSDCLHCVTIC